MAATALQLLRRTLRPGLPLPPLFKNQAQRLLISSSYTNSVRDVNQRFSSSAPVQRPEPKPILQVIPTPNTSHSVKVIFADHQASDFKFLWLRDNCQCKECLHPDSRQKLVDTASLDALVHPISYNLGEDGCLHVKWSDDHHSVYNSKWLYKYGESFLTSEEDPHVEGDRAVVLPKIELWDRVLIWQHMPEISHREVMETDTGLRAWLEMIHKYGIAIMRDVPCNPGQIIKVANRFAYVKPTIWGETFDVVCKPVQSDPSHLAYTGRALELHTDMNYREKSPGLQMLHCLENSSPDEGGGNSIFVDGFYIAQWLQETQPSAFHILASTPVKFAIWSHDMKYSQLVPIICTNSRGDISEIHYNNRTMAPVRLPPDLVMPFYHGYRLFAYKMREVSSIMTFQLRPGDLVAFNNRRVLHGRTAFDSTKVQRHLQGCYVELDEVFTRYRAMMAAAQH